MTTLPTGPIPRVDPRPFTHRPPIFGLDDVVLIVPTRNDARTLLTTLNRIPQPLVSRVGAVVVHDDASFDATTEIARRWALRHLDVGVTVVDGDTTGGRSANLLAAFACAAQRGLRIAVTIPADGSSAPELIASVLRPLVHGAADLVLAPAARRPTAPPTLPVRRVLTNRWNRSAGLHLADWFTTVRGYRLDRLGIERVAHLDNHPQIEAALVRVAAHHGLRVLQPARTPRRHESERSSTHR